MYQPGMAAAAAAAASPKFFLYQPGMARQPKADVPKFFLYQPGIEPGSVPWQGTILPLDH